MTAAELIAALGTVPPDALVVMSSDAEGNSHSPLAFAQEFRYLPDTTWSGEVYGEDDVPTGCEGDVVPAVVLIPTR